MRKVITGVTLGFILLFLSIFITAAPSYAATTTCDSASGTFNLGQKVCFDAGTIMTCVQDNANADARWEPSSCGTGSCEGEPGSASCLAPPTATPLPNGGGDCVVSQTPLGTLANPVTIPAGTAKCISNIAISCTGGNADVVENCSATNKSCTESGSTASCVNGAPTPTPVTTGGNIYLSSGGQILPMPGTNCGVARFKDQAERDAAIARGEDPYSFADACCYTRIQGLLQIPQIGDVPIVGGVVNGVIDFVNKNVIDALPFVGLSKVLPLPTVGTIKSGLDQINKQLCVGGPTFANGTPGTDKCLCYGGDFSGLSKYCQNSPVDAGKCTSCFKDGGIYTSIGCISDISNIQSLVTTVFNVGLGLAGGFAFMCIIYAAFLLQTSGGSPDRIKRSKELMTSCITGLLLIIFSIFILRLIGVQILKIPGFT